MKCKSVNVELYGKLARMDPGPNRSERFLAMPVSGDLRLKALVSNSPNPENELRRGNAGSVWIGREDVFVLMHSVEVEHMTFAKVLHPEHGILVVFLPMWTLLRRWKLVLADPDGLGK